jgi:hypothetical protein
MDSRELNRAPIYAGFALLRQVTFGANSGFRLTHAFELLFLENQDKKQRHGVKNWRRSKAGSGLSAFNLRPDFFPQRFYARFFGRRFPGDLVCAQAKDNDQRPCQRDYRERRPNPDCVFPNHICVDPVT